MFWKSIVLNSPDRADILVEIKARAGGEWLMENFRSAPKQKKHQSVRTGVLGF